MLSRASSERQGAASLSEDVQGHDQRGTVHAPLALMLCPVQSTRVLSGKAGIVVYGHRGAGPVQSSLHALKCITEWRVEIGT